MVAVFILRGDPEDVPPEIVNDVVKTSGLTVTIFITVFDLVIPVPSVIVKVTFLSPILRYLTEAVVPVLPVAANVLGVPPGKVH